MLKIDELEKKWYRYKVKTILFPMASVVFSSVIFVGGYYVYDSKSNTFLTPSHKISKVVLGVSKEMNGSETQESLTLNKVKKELKEVSLEPVIPVIDMEKEERVKESKKYVKKASTHKVNRHTVKAKANKYLTASELTVMAKAEKVKVVKPHVTKKMNFQTTSINYMDTMKEKFLRTGKSRDALLLSRAYYKEGNFKEAEQWALSANKLNSKSEESWFLFAKSKAKLGKKKEALKILISYYKKSHTAKTKELIGQIKTGKI